MLLDDQPAAEVAQAEGVTPQAVSKACKHVLQDVLAAAEGGNLGVAALLAPPNLLTLIRWLERRTLYAGADLSATDVEAVKTVLTARGRGRRVGDEPAD